MVIENIKNDISVKLYDINKSYKLNNNKSVKFYDINEGYKSNKDKNHTITIMISNNYVNATKICNCLGKKIADWKRLDCTKLMIKMFKDDHPKIKPILSVNGNRNINGTYVHPIIFTNIISWCSVKFGYNMFKWIEEWKRMHNNDDVYWDTIQKCEADHNNLREKKIQLKLQKKLGGLIEINTECGRIDILTSDTIIEIKNYDEWKQACGQILMYGDEFSAHEKQVYLFDVPVKNNLIKLIRKKFNKFDITLKIYNYVDRFIYQ